MPRGINIYKITVNGQTKEWVFDDIKYADIVRMVLGYTPRGEGHVMSITYKNGKAGAEGILIVGQKLETVTGMIFNAYDTTNG